jgi:hypothetical protein
VIYHVLEIYYRCRYVNGVLHSLFTRLDRLAVLHRNHRRLSHDWPKKTVSEGEGNRGSYETVRKSQRGARCKDGILGKVTIPVSDTG